MILRTASGPSDSASAGPSERRDSPPGYAEVEIFNQTVWDTPPDETAATVRSRFARLAG